MWPLLMKSKPPDKTAEVLTEVSALSMNWYHVSPADAWWFSEKDRLLCTLGNLTFFRVPHCHWQWKLGNGLTILMWVFKWFWFKSKILIFEIHCWIPWSYSIWISAKKSDICGSKGTPFFFFKKIFFYVNHFKVLIEFATILLLFYVLVFWPWGMRCLSFLARDGTHTPYTGRWTLATGRPGKSLKELFWNGFFFFNS